MAEDVNADNPVLKQWDLSAGDAPPSKESEKANALLEDAASRRSFRRAAFGLAAFAALFLCYMLFKLVCAIEGHVKDMSPWLVGIFATMVVAITVTVLSVIRATFTSPGTSDAGGADDMPQTAVVSEVLKTLSGAIEALSKTLGK